MRRAALIITLLYAVVLIISTILVPILSFLGTTTKVDLFSAYKELHFWAWLLVFIGSQAALLMIPVKVETKRPVTKRTVILPILASSFMVGLLALGAFVSIGEFILWESTTNNMWILGWIEFALVWLLWALIFYRWSKGVEPKGFIDKVTRVLYRGSLLELLVAVPTHIIIRQRPYCCAGFATFIGISIGVAVMLFAFGPALFFLYAARARKKRGGSG